MTQKTEFMEIPELAFMMAEDGGIVCIPRSGPGLKLRDEPRIGIWGIPGIGKTYLIHSIICRAFWKLGWDIHVGILNDRQRETGGWPEPNYGMEVELANLNEKPMPMPMVYLHPNTENPGKIIHEGQGVGHKISLPWDEMILNSGKYFDKLAGTEKYFEQRESKFLELEKPTREDFMEVFKSSEEKLDIMKPPLGSIRKMRALLDQLYSRKIVDIWTGIASKWLLKTNGHSEEYNPFTACLVAGLVPVLVTQNLLKKGYFPQYFQFYANDIFDRHVEDPNFKKIRTWLVIDEILSICKRRKETSASEALENLQTEGRQRRIGTLVATQNYTKVHDRIKTNCNYIICFGTPEASKICNDYSLGKFDADRTRTLSKFECMAYTYDYFVVYDSDGVRTKQKGPIYGKALHPLSEHEAPT